jgi:hypothetical protein
MRGGLRPRFSKKFHCLIALGSGQRKETRKTCPNLDKS